MKSNTNTVMIQNVAEHRATRAWHEFQRRAGVTGIRYQSFRIDLICHVQAAGVNQFVTSGVLGLTPSYSHFLPHSGAASGPMRASLNYWRASEEGLAKVRDLREQCLQKILTNPQ